MSLSLYQRFKSQRFNFFAGVPCSGIKDFIDEAQKDTDNNYIPVNREDTAVALAVGAFFTGKKPLVFMQSSGLGNVVNITSSLLIPYKIPIHYLISIRNKPFEHEHMGTITKRLISLLEWNNNITFVEEEDDEN